MRCNINEKGSPNNQNTTYFSTRKQSNSNLSRPSIFPITTVNVPLHSSPCTFPPPPPPPVLHRPAPTSRHSNKRPPRVITGGTKGIGSALAQKAFSEGARVSLLVRSFPKLEEAQKSIPLTYCVDVAIFATDVCNFDAVERAVVEAGPIDVLAVNHGVFVNQELEKQGLDVVKLMIDVNLMGSFNVIKAALPDQV